MNWIRATAFAACCVAAFVGSIDSASALTFPSQQAQQNQTASTLFNGVGRLVNSNAGNSHVCTASLVGANVIVTADHCLGAGDALRFVLNEPATGSFVSFKVSNQLTLTKYTGSGPVDMSLLTLDRDATGYDIYDLYTGNDEVGQVATLVGAGLGGLTSEGLTLGSYFGSDFKVRYGYNRIDAISDGQLLIDYDNGRAENDVFGRYFGINDTGVRDAAGNVVDVGLIYGDSGGPTFIGNRIAGINIQTGSGSFFETAQGDGCGRSGSVDPVAPTYFGCTDGSAGDFGVSVQASLYVNQVRSYIRSAAGVPAAVPEAATWALMILGFGMMGGFLRTNRGRASGRELFAAA